MSSAIEQYQQVSVQKNVDDANAHQLIQMLIDGALDKIGIAKGDMRKGNIAGKGRNISLAITIVDGLQASLNMDEGGEIAKNLFSLYHYMMEQLVLANMNNATEILDEVAQLLITIKEGWDGIEEDAKIILENRGQ